MAPHVKIPRLEAQLRKEMALERVAEFDADLAAELRAADAALQVFQTTEGDRYASIRSTQKAIIACLTHEAKWLRPREIAKFLANGGFIMDPSNGPRLIVDSVRLAVERGKLQKDGDLHGLPEWDWKPSLNESQ